MWSTHVLLNGTRREIMVIDVACRVHTSKGAGRKDSAVYAITAKLLNPMVIWRITPRNNGQTPKASVWVCLTVRSREGAWRGMFRAHATANINITLSPSSPLSWRAIRVRRGIRGAYRGCAA